MAQHPQLKVEKRTLTGKKVKQLRRDGIVPGNVYGKDITSTAVQVPVKDFMTVYAEAGTGLVDLQLDGKSLPVLIHNVAKDYMRDDVLHVDFFKVNLKEKVKTNVPVELIGEAAAVTNNVGLLQQVINEVEVEALPTDLPEKFAVDVTELEEVDEYIPVEELKLPTGVTVLTDPNQVIVKVAELVSKEAEADAAAAEAEAEAAKTEAGEGETPAESASGGETKPEEGGSEAGPAEDKQEASEEKSE